MSVLFFSLNHIIKRVLQKNNIPYSSTARLPSTFFLPFPFLYHHAQLQPSLHRTSNPFDSSLLLFTIIIILLDKHNGIIPCFSYTILPPPRFFQIICSALSPFDLQFSLHTTHIRRFYSLLLSLPFY